MARYTPSAGVKLTRMVDVVIGALIAGGGLQALSRWLLVPVVSAAAAATVRAAQLAVVVDDEGLLVCNPWRTHRLRWADVREVRLHETESKSSVVLPVVSTTSRRYGVRVWGLAITGERLWRRDGRYPARLAGLERVVAGWPVPHAGLDS